MTGLSIPSTIYKNMPMVSTNKYRTDFLGDGRVVIYNLFLCNRLDVWDIARTFSGNFELSWLARKAHEYGFVLDLTLFNSKICSIVNYLGNGKYTDMERTLRASSLEWHDFNHGSGGNVAYQCLDFMAQSPHKVNFFDWQNASQLRTVGP